VNFAPHGRFGRNSKEKIVEKNEDTARFLLGEGAREKEKEK
jgi:hypothetical protein